MENKKRQKTLTPQSDRLTLEEYLQTYNLRKKIQNRKRSKSKSQSQGQGFDKELDRKEKNVFIKLDKYLEQTKVELSQKIDDLKISREKLLFFLTKSLDKLILDLKRQITQLYKDVYAHYHFQSQNSPTNKRQENQNYFRQKKEEAKQQMNKIKLTDMIKEQVKVQKNNNQIITHLLEMFKSKQHIKKVQSPSILVKQNKSQQKGNEIKQLEVIDFLTKIMKPKEMNQLKGQQQRALPKPNIPVSPKANNQMVRGPKPFERKPQTGFVRKPSKEKN